LNSAPSQLNYDNSQVLKQAEVDSGMVPENVLKRLQITPSSAFSRTIRPGKGLSAPCALFDGLLVSAVVFFKKNRQEDHQPIKPGDAQSCLSPY
jgi:hypothetical protein